MNSKDYWAKRARAQRSVSDENSSFSSFTPAAANKIKVIKTGEKGIDNLKRLLKTNLDDVESKITAFYDKYADKYSEQLPIKDLEKYKAELKRAAIKNPKDKTLNKLLREDAPKYKIDRLRALQTELQILLAEATAGQEKGIYKTLNDVIKVSQATLSKTFKKTIGLEFNTLASHKMKQLLSSDWSGMNWSERLWKDREIVGKKITEILEKGVVQGTSLQTMSRELKNATGTSFNDAFRLIRTETSHIDGQVTLEGYKQAKEELGLEYYEYDAFLDTRTSAICEELNGKRFKVDEAQVGVNYPPMHPNCRSTTQLVLDENYKKEEKETVKVGANENKNNEAKETNKNSAQKISDDKPVLIEKGTPQKGSEIPKEFIKLNDDSKIKEFLEKQDNTIIIKEIKTKHAVIDNKINILNNEYKEITNYINNVDRNKLQQNKEYLNDFFAKFDKRKEINKQIEQLRQDKITETLKSISFLGGGKIDVGTASKNLTNVSKRLKRDLEGIINKDLIKDSKLSITGTNRGRQYFSIAENKLYLTSKTDRATAIHEAMHWLEENNKDVGLKSIKFLEYRTRNDNVEKLKDLTGIKQYKDNEVAKKDKFFSPYCGKIYQNEGKYYASEILSMGMQELINNPLEFYKNDPEYVNFILGVIRNKI